MKVRCIETDIWAPHPEKPGFVTRQKGRTIKEVLDDIIKLLKENDMYDNFDSFTVDKYHHNAPDPNDEFPDWTKIACYTIPGNNEGFFVYVKVQQRTHLSIASMPSKVFYSGRTHADADFALSVSNLLTKAFYDIRS